MLIHNLLQNHGKVFLVGGCVRDLLLLKTPTDTDLSTSIPVMNVINILSQHDIKCLPSGIQFGTATAILNNHQFEITTFRRDIKTDGRRAQVVFTDQLSEDAERRDFTINALYSDMDGNITDFFCGIKDIEDKIVRFIGIPEKRINEDFLRILRYFRFISYIGGPEIDKKSLEAACNLHEGLGIISGERIKGEMLKLLGSPYVGKAVELMKDSLIPASIGMPQLNGLRDVFFVNGAAIVNLALIFKLLKCDDVSLCHTASRWKMSAYEKTMLLFLNQYEYPFHISSNINFHLQEYYKLQHYFPHALLLKAALDSHEAIDAAHNIIVSIEKNYIKPKFPLSGFDLQDYGLSGRDLGNAKDLLIERWIKSDFTLTKDELLSSLARNFSALGIFSNK